MTWESYNAVLISVARMWIPHIVRHPHRGAFWGECSPLINIVLLPMQRWIRLDDDGLARGVLKVFDQGGLARLQGLGDFRVDAAECKVFV
jgi:hypothetical protein